MNPSRPDSQAAESGLIDLEAPFWIGSPDAVVTAPENWKAMLLAGERPVWILQTPEGFGLTFRPSASLNGHSAAVTYRQVGSLPAVRANSLGSPEFRARYGLQYALYAGAMANGISSEALVIALGKAGMLGSFGAAGLSPARVEAAIQRIQAELPNGPYLFNLIHSPNEPALELRLAQLYLQHGVHAIEASAYLDMTRALVFFRATGLSAEPDGKVKIQHRIIAKLSRKEVARRFLSPAPEDLLADLLAQGLITAEQADLARRVPVADDITVEADSGGHTDNRPLVGLLPTMIALRDEIQRQQGYAERVHIGAAGGISTAASALAAFMMGADYVVTGSLNQACVESGASEHTRKLLAQADMADVVMAPAADMFEMGVKVQLLKRGTLYPIRAQKLFELYSRYPSIEAIPAEEREKLEKQVFRRKLDEVWADTVQFFTQRDPTQLERALKDPHQKMALVFRWYLGLSSRWSATGEVGRELDYQIWCGPAMGTFNDWVRSTYLVEPSTRRAVDVSMHLLTGAAYLYRIQLLKLHGVRLPAELESYYPEKPLV